MDDLSGFCCLNPACLDHGKRGLKNLTVTVCYVPAKAKRMLRFQTWKARFSERKGTPLLDARLPAAKLESVLEHIAEGCGVRQTGRLCRVDRPPWPAPANSLAVMPRAPMTTSRPFPPERPICIR